MIGDRITYHPGLKPLTMAIVKKMEYLLQSGSKFCIAVGGESGCGKSTLAHALQAEIRKASGLKGYIFQMDDYFKLPPKDNHNARLADINRVGTGEVDILLLDHHIKQFKKGQISIQKPLVDYYGNTITPETVDFSDVHYCIVEGTYTCTIAAADYKLFMGLNYMDTKAHRKKRNRDILSDFNERVLAIEHSIIQPHANLADLIIDKHLNIRTKT